MAFLDNSGDIILDAVLTDAGRKRLARGDGSFKITQYSFGDDEINYGRYIADHVSGSAYFDLEILQTPILEAFTNNISSLKSKLLSLTNNNLLYLPVIKLNTIDDTALPSAANSIAPGSHAVLVDTATVSTFGNGTAKDVGNYINGFQGSTGGVFSKHIRLDQGLDTNEISANFNLDAELTEQQYIVEIDNRLGSITDINGGIVNPSFIDDDNIASYYLSTGPIVSNLQSEDENGSDTNSSLQGPPGTKLEFSILASLNLRTSTFLFDQIGNSSTFSAQSFKFIDTLVRVTGATTGYRIDVPVRFIKKT
ncbi:hypothetical protein [Phenylobacterium sp.]|uniref:hypothetical protein n=1 Tax=Phenylobacterium sp. TaxID=1871053 RepID=UPI0025E927CE|nr:hypothetical protein [Phenylobacterium sp.]